MRKHELVNTETGELVPAITWIRQKWKGDPFLMVFQASFEALAKDKEITLDARRILDFLFSRLDFENYILIPQVEIATELGMQRSNVSRAMSILLGKGIILEGPKVNRSRGYRLNHDFGWKGTLKNLRVIHGKGAR